MTTPQLCLKHNSFPYTFLGDAVLLLQEVAETVSDVTEQGCAEDTPGVHASSVH